MSLDCQKPTLVTEIGIGFALKIQLSFLPPGINSFTIECMLLRCSLLFVH